MTRRDEDNDNIQRKPYRRRRSDRSFRIMAITYIVLGTILMLKNILAYSVSLTIASIFTISIGIGLWLYSNQLKKDSRVRMIVATLLMDVERRFRETVRRSSACSASV